MTIKVFLVEDSASIRENLTGALEELAPVEVIGFAEDEEAAIAWLEANAEQCDLLIIDIFLKRGSGIGVLRAVSGRRSLTKVVASNYFTEEILRRCIELGAHRVFDKSTQFEELVAYCSRIDSGDTRGGGL